MAKTTVRRVGARRGAVAVRRCLWQRRRRRQCRHDGGSRHRSTGHRGSGLGSAQTEPTASDQPTGGTGGALAGLKGTTPLVELSQEFQDKLLAIDLSLGTTFNYAAETYDAINIIALAVEKAKTDGIDYAKEINGITRDGEKCTDFATQGHHRRQW